MRHAEKSGDPLDADLSLAGRQRAQRLVNFLPSTFGKPDCLFATLRSKHSNRPYETLEPLAQSLRLAIDATFADQDYPALAHSLRSDPQFEGKCIVVCWHHGNIPSLCQALNAQSGAYPDPWNSSLFNLILQFDFNQDNPKISEVLEPF
jgi:hypothetical protein